MVLALIHCGAAVLGGESELLPYSGISVVICGGALYEELSEQGSTG